MIPDVPTPFLNMVNAPGNGFHSVFTRRDHAPFSRIGSVCLLVAVNLSFLSSVGCGSMTRQVARNATPVAVESGMQAAMSDESQQTFVEAIDPERVEQGTEKLAAGATDGLVNALGQEERQERLINAMAPVVSSIVDTAMERALSDEQLARVRELAKQATLGFQDAIDEVKTQKERGQIPEDKGNVLEAANDVAETGDITLYLVGALAAALFLLLLIGSIWAVRRKRKYELDGRQRDQALDELTRILVSEAHGTDNFDQNSPERNHGTSTDRDRLREAVRHLSQQRQTSTGLHKQ